MSSSTNQFPPWPPYETYRDCSQGICSIYCPQWCYLMFPPPPPSRQFSSANDSDGGDSSSDFSPLIIAVIGILASAFILITYYTIISKYCRRRRGRTTIDEIRDHHSSGDPHRSWMTTSEAVGLEESVIKSITVLNYRKDDGVVEGSDCSVCLSEFEEEEKIRLLPKCHHAFHVSCIDAWFKSHATCPLCRDNINGSASSSSVVVSFIPLPPEEAEQQMATLPPPVASEITAAAAAVVDDIECGGQSEEGEHGRQQVPEMRRSSSLNFEGVPARMMKRSVSTGRFVLMSRDGNSSSNTIPV